MLRSDQPEGKKNLNKTKILFSSVCVCDCMFALLLTHAPWPRIGGYVFLWVRYLINQSLVDNCIVYPLEILHLQLKHYQETLMKDPYSK